MKYRSKIDLFNFIQILMIIAVLALPCVLLEFSWLYFGIMLAIDLFLVLFLFCLSYELTEEKLIVRLGFIIFSIDYDRITKISLVYNVFMSSCGTCVKQIKIDYGKIFSCYISPENEEDFIKKLKEKCPHIDEVKNKRK